MNKLKYFIVAVFLLLAPATANAEIQSLSAQAEYLLQDSERVKDGQDVAFNEAMRRISQQAGVYVESQSKSANSSLTNDEITLITSTLVQVKEKKFTKTLDERGKIIVHADVRAELDTEQSYRMMNDVAAARKAAKSYEAIQKEYAAANTQMTALQEEYAKHSDKAARHHIRLGQKKEQAGDLAGALACYEEAIATAPDYARSYSRRGHIYRKQGNLDLAKKDYDKASSLDKNEAGAHLGKAMILEGQGKDYEAWEEYRLFVRLADIIEYDTEIIRALDRMLVLFDGI